MAYILGGRPVDRVLAGNTLMNPGNTTTTDLGNTSVIEAILFRIYGTLTNASYTTAPTKAVESIENLVSSFRNVTTRKVDGGQAGTLINVDAADLAYTTRIGHKTAPKRIDVGTANAAYAFESNFKHKYGLERSNIYSSTFLDSRNLSSNVLQTTWRTVADLFTSPGVAGTSTLTNTGLGVTLRTWEGCPKAGLWAPMKLRTQRRYNVAQSGDNVPFNDVPLDGVLIRQTFKGTVGPNDHTDPSDALFASANKAEGAHLQLLTKNYLESAGDTLYAQMQADDKDRYTLESVPTGYATAEYSRTGDYRDAVDLRDGRRAKNVLDLTYTGGSTNTLCISDERVVFQK